MKIAMKKIFHIGDQCNKEIYLSKNFGVSGTFKLWISLLSQKHVQ